MQPLKILYDPKQLPNMTKDDQKNDQKLPKNDPNMTIRITKI